MLILVVILLAISVGINVTLITEVIELKKTVTDNFDVVNKVLKCHHKHIKKNGDDDV